MMNTRHALKLFLPLITCALALSGAQKNQKAEERTESDYRVWRMYGGGADNLHYSSLRQINRANVSQLKTAWTYNTGDAFEDSEMQCNPIIVDGALYATSPKLRVFALDAATGKERWSFDPNEGRKPLKMRNRGVTYWEAGEERRIFFGYRQWLYALDARTGQPAKEFGAGGRIDLRQGLGRADEGLPVTLTSPGLIYRDLLIVGSVMGKSLPSAPGHIRAYDVRTGKLRWTFHTIPHPGEFGYDTWPKEAWQYSGGANNWSGMALDEKRGLLFAPTGAAAFEFYGVNRHGDNLFANSLLCLDAATGKRVWHFQVVKHDVWDRDLPAAPLLVTVRRNGRRIDAVAQLTKTGHVFVFERETGKPVFPIEYRNVPAAGVDGEKLATTQPFPLLPPPVARQELTEAMLTRRTPEAHAAVLARFRKLKSNGQFEPPSKDGTIVLPGFDGGPGWGGAAFDPATSLFFVNASEVPCILRLVERPRKNAVASGKSLYERNCASCHGRDLSGNPPDFPALNAVGKKYNEAEISGVIRNGLGRMPGFAALGNEAIQAITRYLTKGEDIALADYEKTAPSLPSLMDLKYTFDGYNRFFDPDGYPAIKPPWGTLTALDLNKGEIVWQIPLGEHPELVAQGLRDTGSWNYGGPIVTAGDVVFIGATNYDKKFRAFDKLTGKLLWETALPFAGNATPATYEINGRQFIVIAAGGGKRGAPSGGTYVAFALPRGEAASQSEQSEAARWLDVLKQEQWADEQAPQSAAEKLAEMGGPVAHPLFRAMLASNNNRALHWMEYALCRMAEHYAGRPDDVKSPLAIFLATLDDRRESYDLRRLAARMLGKLGDARAVPVLRNNLSDARVALAVAHSLGAIKTPAARQTLVNQLATARPLLKAEILKALGQRSKTATLAATETRAPTRRGQSGGPIHYAEDFERGIARSWEPVNPEDWQVLREGANRFYALTRRFNSGIPRRPIQIALLKDKSFGDVTFTCRVRRPDPQMTSLILVFGYQDETHFYYAHLSSDSSAKTWVHNGLFIVDGAPRRRIGTMEAAAILPDTNWRRIRIAREIASGRIAVYVDDAPQPALEATDHRFRWGQIGLGSFTEVGHFDDLDVTGFQLAGSH